MNVTCPNCAAHYDDADCSTLCPHGLIMPQADLDRKKLALALQDAGGVVRFRHQPDGPDRRIICIEWNGMVGFADFSGVFDPGLFLIVRT